MQAEFKAIVQSEHGAPQKVLRIAKRQLKGEEPGADDVLVKIIARPIHHGDIQILSALPQADPVVNGARRSAFISADDDDAKKRVQTLLENCGYSVVDPGNPRDGGLIQQAGGPMAGRDFFLGKENITNESHSSHGLR
jgi:NADPH:quinone reductase-like Zn-dependent oxidoreductase